MHYTLESKGEKFTNRVVGMTISSKQVNNVILKVKKKCKNQKDGQLKVILKKKGHLTEKHTITYHHKLYMHSELQLIFLRVQSLS